MKFFMDILFPCS